MSQLRHDPLSGRDVIIAAGRAARPNTFATSHDEGASVSNCPFCPGNEAATPPEVARVGHGAPDEPGWQVRAFPNLYPIVEAHEVVVLSPDHRSFAELGDDEAATVFTVLRDRSHAHLDAGHAYGVAILNHLRGAGASIAHPHAQVFALDVVPRAVETAVERVRAAGVDLVREDAAPDALLVTRSDEITVWCPAASTSPYQLRLAHDAAGERFDLSPDEVIQPVAVTLRHTLARLRDALGDVPYNVVVHTAPRDGTPFHWYIEVIPRVAVVAGFEQATGILVNTVPPDQAAEVLRAAAATSS
jgi:UDPglucose--hexose-1-phosphate uridylyltransferase